MTLAAPIYHTQPQGRLTRLWQDGLLLALWVWGLMVGGRGIYTNINSSPLAATNASDNLMWKENHRPYGERQLEVEQGQMQC